MFTLDFLANAALTVYLNTEAEGTQPSRSENYKTATQDNFRRELEQLTHLFVKAVAEVAKETSRMIS